MEEKNLIFDIITNKYELKKGAICPYCRSRSCDFEKIRKHVKEHKIDICILCNDRIKDVEGHYKSKNHIMKNVKMILSPHPNLYFDFINSNKIKKLMKDRNFLELEKIAIDTKYNYLKGEL